MTDEECSRIGCDSPHEVEVKWENGDVDKMCSFHADRVTDEFEDLAEIVEG